MAAFQSLARAKVNLTLDVLGRRPDGYHDIASTVVFADFGDVIEFFPGRMEAPLLHVVGPYGGDIAGENLVTKAAGLFWQRYPSACRGRFVLHKNLPVASGIGGGSADAAAALRCLSEANNIDWENNDELFTLALDLGADVPVCLYSRASIMTGIGDMLHPIDANIALAAVLANPNETLSTAQVFGALSLDRMTSRKSGLLPIADRDDFLAHIQDGKNDLEAPAISLLSVIQEVKTALLEMPGCSTARMSGSGATCFGLFETPEDANEAAQKLAAAQPGWWIKPVRLS